MVFWSELGFYGESPAFSAYLWNCQGWESDSHIHSSVIHRILVKSLHDTSLFRSWVVVAWGRSSVWAQSLCTQHLMEVGVLTQWLVYRSTAVAMASCPTRPPNLFKRIRPPISVTHSHNTYTVCTMPPPLQCSTLCTVWLSFRCTPSSNLDTTTNQVFPLCTSVTQLSGSTLCTDLRGVGADTPMLKDPGNLTPQGRLSVLNLSPVTASLAMSYSGSVCVEILVGITRLRKAILKDFVSM